MVKVEVEVEREGANDDMYQWCHWVKLFFFFCSHAVPIAPLEGMQEIMRPRADGTVWLRIHIASTGVYLAAPERTLSS